MLTIDVIDPQTGAVAPLPLSPGQMCSWRPLPGADGVRLVLRDDGLPLLHAETLCPGGLPALFEIQQTPQGWQALAPGGRPLLPLPPSDVAKPSILPARTRPALDLFFLIDGTTLHPKPGGSGTLAPLIAKDSPDWAACRALLQKFAAQLAAPALRTGVGAFGDEPLAPGHHDGYLLHPKTWNLTSSSAADRDWAELRPADGGDFVDALADGLRHCRSLPWNPEARKLLVLFGDSPGYSVLDAARPGIALADAQLRQCDVHEEAAALHDLGIELVTIFHSPGIDSMREQYSYAPELIQHTRRQYQRLATLPEWCQHSPGWDPAAFAHTWKNWTGLLARGFTPPLAPLENS